MLLLSPKIPGPGHLDLTLFNCVCISHSLLLFRNQEFPPNLAHRPAAGQSSVVTRSGLMEVVGNSSLHHLPCPLLFHLPLRVLETRSLHSIRAHAQASLPEDTAASLHLSLSQQHPSSLPSWEPGISDAKTHACFFTRQSISFHL